MRGQTSIKTAEPRGKISVRFTGLDSAMAIEPVRKATDTTAHVSFYHGKPLTFKRWLAHKHPDADSTSSEVYDQYWDTYIDSLDRFANWKHISPLDAYLATGPIAPPGTVFAIDSWVPVRTLAVPPSGFKFDKSWFTKHGMPGETSTSTTTTTKNETSTTSSDGTTSMTKTISISTSTSREEMRRYHSGRHWTSDEWREKYLPTSAFSSSSSSSSSSASDMLKANTKEWKWDNYVGDNDLGAIWGSGERK
jgi:hypothetical protein